MSVKVNIYDYTRDRWPHSANLFLIIFVWRQFKEQLKNLLLLIYLVVYWTLEKKTVFIMKIYENIIIVFVLYVMLGKLILC
jgi:hypothetical protein